MLNCFHGGRMFDAIGSAYRRLDALDQHYPADVLDAWYPPAPQVIAKVSEHLPWSARTSPPPCGQNLRELIAAFYNLSTNTIVLGSGSSELIYRIFPSLVDKRGVLIPKPAYGEYEHLAKTILGFPVFELLTDSNAFWLDIDQLIAKAIEMEPAAPAAIVLINPSNPSGSVVSREDLIKVLDAIPPSTALVVDETYSEYNNRQESVADLCPDFANLIVFKSLSKVYALSGMRVGFCVMHPDRAHDFILRTPPYIVPTPTQIALFTSFDHQDYYHDRIQETHAIRDRFQHNLIQTVPRLNVVDSCINSLLIDLSQAGMHSETFTRVLRNRCIYVRNIDSQGLSREARGRYVRISILNAQAMQHITQVIADIFSRPEDNHEISVL